MELNCVENHLRKSLEKNFKDGRLLTVGRVAHITEVEKLEQEEHLANIEIGVGVVLSELILVLCLQHYLLQNLQEI